MDEWQLWGSAVEYDGWLNFTRDEWFEYWSSFRSTRAAPASEPSPASTFSFAPDGACDDGATTLPSTGDGYEAAGDTAIETDALREDADSDPDLYGSWGEPWVPAEITEWLDTFDPQPQMDSGVLSCNPSRWGYGPPLLSKRPRARQRVRLTRAALLCRPTRRPAPQSHSRRGKTRRMARLLCHRLLPRPGKDHISFTGQPTLGDQRLERKAIGSEGGRLLVQDAVHIVQWGRYLWCYFTGT